jgi:hypothetical protein
MQWGVTEVLEALRHHGALSAFNFQPEIQRTHVEPCRKKMRFVTNHWTGEINSKKGKCIEVVYAWCLLSGGCVKYVVNQADAGWIMTLLISHTIVTWHLNYRNSGARRDGRC